MIVLVLISLIIGPVWSNVDGHLETVLAVTQCRASCIDQFSHMNRNETNCLNESDCFACWEMCKIIVERFELWSPLCVVPEVCPPGCQLACNYAQTERNESFYNTPTLLLKSRYSKDTDHLTVEWEPDQDLEGASTILYAVLLKDKNQQWNQITQTTSHIVHIDRELINRQTEIRILAANGFKFVSDSQNLYLGSHVTESFSESINQYTKNLWKPHLESLKWTETGLQATVVWPIKEDENGPMQYEISWSVIDETLEVTGHLHTTNNAAVLTLWADSVYSVQVNCYGANKTLRSQSEPLVVNTKNASVDKEIERINQPVCPQVGTVATNAFAILSAFFITCIIIAIAWVSRSLRSRSLENNQFKVENLSHDAGTYQVRPVMVQHAIMIPEEAKTVDKKLQGLYLV